MLGEDIRETSMRVEKAKAVAGSGLWRKAESEQTRPSVA
jgi:hypothetical protein